MLNNNIHKFEVLIKVSQCFYHIIWVRMVWLAIGCGRYHNFGIFLEVFLMVPGNSGLSVTFSVTASNRSYQELLTDVFLIAFCMIYVLFLSFSMRTETENVTEFSVSAIFIAFDEGNNRRLRSGAKNTRLTAIKRCDD